MKEYIERLLDFALPDLSEEHKDPAEIVRAKGICLSMGNLQFLFELIVHDYVYYSQNYPDTTSRIKLKHVSVSNPRVDFWGTR